MSRLPPTSQTAKKLFALSGNRCAFPGCSQKLVDEEGNLVVQICHIEAAEVNGERYNPNQTDEERRSFENLILLCPNHHAITNDTSKYSVDVLKDMKEKHESQFKEAPFQVSDETVEKSIRNYARRFSINCTNIGDGTQIVYAHDGLDYPQTRQLFIDLFEQNFPKLRSIAAKEAEKRVQQFVETFFSFAHRELTSNDIEAFQSPDLQFIINKAIEFAARHDYDLLRSQLSLLIIKRIKNRNIDLKRKVYNEAILSLGKLTINQLKVLTLHFLLYEYVFIVAPKSWDELNSYYEEKVKPFLDFDDTHIDFRYIGYCGFCRIETEFGASSYAQILKNRLKFLFPHLGKERDEQQYIEKEICENIALGAALINPWKTSYLWSIELSAVGIVIVETFYELFTKDKGFIKFNKIFDTK